MLDQIIKLETPAPYEPGEPMFWTDPHIASQMLAAHLDPNTDAASYRPERIDAVCRFLQRRLSLRQGDCVADLGCGPGLYDARLAEMGCRVTGIDFSRSSVEYARRQAEGTDNPPDYRLGNYLEWNETGRYRAVLMISEDYGVLAPGDRNRLLANVCGALQDGGYFALDVASLAAFDRRTRCAAMSWQALDHGFWRPHPHLVLEENILYPGIPAACSRYVVIDGRVTDYRIYLTYFSPESITGEMEDGGFAVEEVYSGIDGQPWREDSPQIGVICRKA